MPPTFDLAHVAYRIQYIPAQETPQEDQELKPATPTGISVEAGELSIAVTVTPGAPLEAGDVIEVFASITNNRPDAERVAWGRVTEFTVNLPSGGTRYYWTRIRREIDGPDLFSDFLPASATEGVVQTALDFAGELPSATGVFLDTFEHQDYARFYNLRAGTPTITYPTNGENGGRVIRIQNFGWIAWKKNIPYDPTAIYMMTVRAKMAVAATAGANDIFYAGVEGVAADGTTLVDSSTGANNTGNQHYFCASGFDLGAGAAIGTWQTFRGYLSGHSATPAPQPAPNINSPCEAYSSGANVVKFIRPLIIVNYNGGDGIAEVDYARIDRVVVTDNLGPNAATAVYFDSDNYAGTAFGNGVELQSFIFTPARTCDLEISALAVADNVLGDSGNNLRITVQPTGGSETVIGATGANSATRQQHAIDANYSATGGVEITIRHKTLVSGSSIHVWASSLRIAELKA